MVALVAPVEDAADAERRQQRRVLVGHKPSGDSPAVLSSDYTGVEIISADTSYSDPAAGPTADGDAPRGCAVACVTLRGASAEVNHAEISGVLKDGRRHEVALRTLEKGIVELGTRHLMTGLNLTRSSGVETIMAITPMR